MSQTEVQLIKDAVIVNADISNSAAIDVSKISGALPAAGGTITGDVTFDGSTAGRFVEFQAIPTSFSITSAVGEVTAADISFEVNGAPTGLAL